MSQPRTLGVVIVALPILMCLGFPSAQAMQCRNSMEALSVILKEEKVEPASSQQFEGSFFSTIGAADIARCLRAGQRLVNHVIRYRDYVDALRSVPIEEILGGSSELVIEDSVLWSPKEGTVDLSHLGEEGIVGRSIRWTGVVLGPSVSGRNVIFRGDIDLSGATLHGEVNFIGAEFGKVDFSDAIFNGIARFYSATIFRGPTFFTGVEFRGEAFFHDETTFHDKVFFSGATFDGNSHDYSETTGEAYFNAGTRFLDDVDFEGATFNVRPHFSADTFKSGVSFNNAVFRVEARFQGIPFPGPTSFRNTQFDMGGSFQKAVFSQRTIFDGAQFRQYADFDNVRFVKGAKVFFTNSIFDAEASFGEARFTGATRFQNVQFNVGASFQKAVFNQQAVFAGAQFRQHADFDGVTFAEESKVSLAGVTSDAEAAFGGITFPGATSLRDAQFNVGVSFAGSVFDVEAAFGGITFPGPTSFRDAQFNVGASFQKAVFNQQAVFAGAQFRQHADFDHVQFAKEAKVSFAGSIFDVEAAFGGITFPGPASFRNAQFNVGASFQNAEFQQDAVFEGAAFAGYLSFRDTEFKDRLRLVDATWEDRADFRRSIIANLDWDSEDRPSIVKGVFDAREARLESMTIKDVHFSDLADFSGATFGNAEPGTEENIIFQDVIFERAADFLRADFHADAIFVGNRFRGLLDFTNAKFAMNVRLCLLDNRMGSLLMDREHLIGTQAWQLLRKLSPNRILEESRFRAANVTTSETDTNSKVAKTYSCAKPNELDGHHEHLQKIYRSVESSFRSANDRWGENEAWYLGTVASRKKGDGILDVIWDFVLLILLDFPSRYGIDYVRALAVSAGWVLLFWAVYWLYFHRVFLKKGEKLPCIKLAAVPEQRRALRFRPFERLFYPVVCKKRSLIPWQDGLFLSCRAFFKLGLGSSYPPLLGRFVYFRMGCWHVHADSLSFRIEEYPADRPAISQWVIHRRNRNAEAVRSGLWVSPLLALCPLSPGWGKSGL